MTTLSGKSVLVTGGTGSFGKKFVEVVLKRYKPRKLIIFSRDELKQFEMQQVFNASCMRYFIGDVRDKERLYRAVEGVDVVVHAAALKQIPTAEYNPFEAIQTNIMGAQNLISACIDREVKHVLAISSDKAVNPVNLYGATKLCAEKLFVASNSYVAEGKPTRFSVVRYGNVVGSRGSVIPLFKEKEKTGVLPITDPRMTRFWTTLEQGVEFVLKCLWRMESGEIFIPKIPSMKIVDLAKVVCPKCKQKVVGIRPGEKLHEVLVGKDESRNVLEYEDYFVICPSFPFWTKKRFGKNGGRKVREEFEYASNNNKKWLTVEQLRRMI